MTEIFNKINILNNIKNAIKGAITLRGEVVGNDMQDYPDAIRQSSGCNYLKFTANAPSTIYLNNLGGNNPNCEYASNQTPWTPMPTSENDKINLSTGDSIYVRGVNPQGFATQADMDIYSTFVMTGSISASGSIMSLIDGVGETTTIPNNYCFYKLFSDCSALTTAPELPATTLTDGCYFEMFYYCSSLTSAPELPAETLTDYCYSYMFAGCSSLSEERVFFNDWSESLSATDTWNGAISNSGTFYCPHDLNIERSVDEIPSGWKVLYNTIKKIEITQSEYNDLDNADMLDPEAKYIIVS